TRERVSPALELAQKLAGLGAIAAGDFLVGGHATLTRRGLALELVLVVHAFTHDLASASHAHALLGAAVRLLLRHGAVLLCNSLSAELRRQLLHTHRPRKVWNATWSNFSRIRASCVLLCSDPIATGLHLGGLALGTC